MKIGPTKPAGKTRVPPASSSGQAPIPSEAAVEAALIDAAQFIDSLKDSGVREGWWSDWDQATRDKISTALRAIDHPAGEVAKGWQPQPDLLIEDTWGGPTALMFYFAAADQSWAAIAAEQGFECKSIEFSEDHPLFARYEEGDAAVVTEWQPDVPDGWTMGGKLDTEDGLIAVVIRRLSSAPRPPKSNSGGK